MTRKDFELIAETTKGCDLRQSDREAIAREFAYALKRTNPNFKAERFVAACGVEAR